MTTSPGCDCPPLDAKAVDPVRASAQVIVDRPTGSDAKAVDSRSVDGNGPDAKAVDFAKVGESLASPRAAELYRQSQVVDPWPGDSYAPQPPDIRSAPDAVGVSWEREGGPTLVGAPFYLGTSWADGLLREHPPGIYRLDGLVQNTVAHRAETPPSTAEAVAKANAERAARKARARREKARRVARDRARGIRPCTHDCDRGDDW